MKFWAITSMVCLSVFLVALAPAVVDGKWISATTALALCGLLAAYASFRKATKLVPRRVEK